MSDMRSRARSVRLALCGAAVISLLAACGGGGGLGAGDDGSPSTLPEFATTLPVFEPVTPSMPPPPEGESYLPDADPMEDPQASAALEDLAQRLGVDAGDIEVVVWDAVTWSDGSIGCPQPGMGYTQALVEGVRIVLEYEGQQYNYHAAENGIPALCELKDTGGLYGDSRNAEDY